MKVRLKTENDRTTPLDGIRCLRRKDEGVIEARILDHESRRMLAGFFSSPKQLNRALSNLNGHLDTASVYVTLNPVRGTLLDRCRNRFARAARGQQSTDGDILRRVWFPIDVDPIRKKDTASTQRELLAAIAKRDEIARYLGGRGWAPPVKALSGNGAHALFAVDLPNTAEITTLFKRTLKALATKFNDEHTSIDTSVSNAARIWKLYGTRARKGAPTKKRPHRLARIESQPTVLRKISREQLQAVANIAPVTAADTPAAPRDLVEAFKQRGWYLRERADGGHDVRCPWQEAHSGHSGDTETVLYEPSADNGFKGGFKCMHDHCSDRSIKDLRELMPVSSALLRCLDDVQPEEVHWFWHPYIPLGKLTLIEGDPGIGKSWFSLELATATARGKGLPGMIKRQPANSLLLTAEDGPGDTIRPRVDALGGDVKRIFLLEGPLTFDESGLRELDQAIARTGAVLVVVDPLVAYLGAKVDLHRANETRAVMARLAEIAARHLCAIVLIRHLTKSGKDKAIYRGLGSIDLTAACRSVLLVGRDPENTERAAVVHTKSNLAKSGDSQGYTVERGRFLWTGPSSLTASDLLAPEATGDGAGAVDEAEDFLRATLKTGATEAATVKKLATDAGIRYRTLRRARERLGVESKPTRDSSGKAQCWTWKLPGTSKSSGRASETEGTSGQVVEKKRETSPRN